MGNEYGIDIEDTEYGVLIGRAKGRREGLREGRQEGSARTLIRLLSGRFGYLPRDLRDWIGVLTIDDLDQLTDALLGFRSLDSLWIWLANERRPVGSRSRGRVNQLLRCRPEFSSK